MIHNILHSEQVQSAGQGHQTTSPVYQWDGQDGEVVQDTPFRQARDKLLQQIHGWGTGNDQQRNSHNSTGTV